MTNLTETHKAHWLRLIFAVIAGPVLVTLLTFWALIPVYAFIIGGPFFLCFASLFALWMMPRFGARYDIAMIASVLSLALIPLVTSIYGWWAGAPGLGEWGLLVATFGLIFAPIYAAAFLFVYRNAPSALPAKV